MDPYEPIAAFYDLEHDDFDEDIAFYRQLLAEGPIFEVGTGTGRVAVPLARDGLEVWGIDQSPAMLRRARSRGAGISTLRLVEGDVRTLRLERRFKAALFTLNAIWHFSDAESQLQSLRSVAAHAESGGLIVVDTSNPHSMDDHGANGLIRLRHRYRSGGEEVSTFSAAWDDEGAQILTLDLWYDRAGKTGAVRRSSARLVLRYLYRYELELLLRLAGLRVEQLYGSYDLDPYETASPRLLAVARCP
jgi:SAM-dependent methyltransferase